MFKKLLITYFSLYLALNPVVNATTQTQTTNTQAIANNKVDTQTQTTNTQPTNSTTVNKLVNKLGSESD